MRGLAKVGPDAKSRVGSPNKSGGGVVNQEGSPWCIRMGDWKLGKCFFSFQAIRGTSGTGHRISAFLRLAVALGGLHLTHHQDRGQMSVRGCGPAGPFLVRGSFLPLS